MCSLLLSTKAAYSTYLGGRHHFGMVQRDGRRRVRQQRLSGGRHLTAAQRQLLLHLLQQLPVAKRGKNVRVSAMWTAWFDSLLHGSPI